ncbi:DUF1365 domain-containing protein [Aeromonas enteropelogenes]|uniref:DUF1365 domain-containing protein n=1 Tax=Aeromonas enteropelogenes TaxID=29489 RepID=UPI001CCC9F5A|nr:DUF1365 domain-containing protein [Aeromonas enteropelogenes]UBH27298.1 DUF1365 domain-containing protein [Aeromonas enteropelogenes]
MKGATATVSGGISAIWRGSVRHRRFAPRVHVFSYHLFMLGLDLDELPGLDQGRWFAVERAGLLSFRRQDYLRGSAGPLKQAVWDKVAELGGDADPKGRVLLLGNVRCLGFYFSPVNFYFCDRQGKTRYLLAEVSNTPWNERHYYLLDLAALAPHDKDFHVSPFMELAMRYHWRIRPPAQETLIHIESHPVSGEAKLFDATLALRRVPLSRKELVALLVRWPWMTMRVLLGIYWQALRLFIKRTPIFTHPETR